VAHFVQCFAERQGKIIDEVPPASLIHSGTPPLPADALPDRLSASARYGRSCNHRSLDQVLEFADVTGPREVPGPEKELRELVDPLAFPHVHADHGLHLALERLGSNGLDLLPVVSRANAHQLLGVVTLHDVLPSYGVTHEP
jgi:hypothetical protein